MRIFSQLIYKVFMSFIPSFQTDAEQLFMPNSEMGGFLKSSATTFADNMKLPVHRWYRYSAGYSAEWAGSLMRHWGVKNVLDPFGGSGTTVLSAQEQGINAYGVDVHPFITKIAKAKLSWDVDIEELKEKYNYIISSFKERKLISIPSSPLARKCFPDDEVFYDLLKIRDCVLDLEQESATSQLIWLAFVGIIRVTSPAGTAQWQYILPNKTKSRIISPLFAFQKNIEMFYSDIIARKSLVFEENLKLNFLEADSKSLSDIPDGWADAIITSPPYANNYDYADATRFEQIILGDIQGWSDLKSLRKSLVKSATQNLSGWKSEDYLDSSELSPIIKELLPVWSELAEVRKTKGGNKPYHSMLAGYFYDNAQVFKALRKKSQPGVKVCYVVGDSAPYGVHAPVEKWLGEIALAAGFKSWGFTKIRDRNIKWKNRKHQHPLHEGYLWIEG